MKSWTFPLLLWSWFGNLDPCTDPCTDPVSYPLPSTLSSTLSPSHPLHVLMPLPGTPCPLLSLWFVPSHPLGPLRSKEGLSPSQEPLQFPLLSPKHLYAVSSPSAACL